MRGCVKLSWGFVVEEWFSYSCKFHHPKMYAYMSIRPELYKAVNSLIKITPPVLASNQLVHTDYYGGPAHSLGHAEAEVKQA